jgi:hypothetical protein
MYALCCVPGRAVLKSPLTTDFSDYALGDADTQGWSRSSTSQFNATIVAVGSTGTPVSAKALKIDKTTADAARAITFDAVPIGTTDVEILAHVLIATLPTGVGETVGMLLARYTNISNYYIALPRNASGGTTKKFEIGKNVAGADTVLDNATLAFDITEFWWLRFRIVGTSVKAKMWRHTASEPAAWTVTDTDSSHAAGKVGLGAFFAAYDYRCDFFSVALGGATAPGPGG